MRFQTSRVFQVKDRCVLAAVALLFSFFLFREQKKNEQTKMNKKRRDFLMNEKGGQVVTYLFLVQEYLQE